MKDKKIKDLTLQNVLFLIAFSALLILCLLYWDLIFEWVMICIDLLKPFIMAVVFAFIFNMPLTFFTRKLPKKYVKGRKAIAVVLSLLCIIGAVVLIVMVVAPQVIESASMLVDKFPGYVDAGVSFVENLLKEEDASASFMQAVNTYGKEIESFVMNAMEIAFPRLISLTSGVFSMLTNVVMAIVIAIYMTISKEKLIGQCKRVLYAFLNEKQYRYVIHTIKLANTTFSSFFSGQLMEAIIIGVLCYLGCIILRIEYAPILGVVIGCTNIIPIFGPIIGTGIGALLLLFVSPWQSLIFIVFGTALQQFESNLIYPRVVGTSVGLSGLWTLAAVSIGGGLFGLLGMVFGLPTFAVLYRLFAEEVNRRNALKQRSVTHAVD